MRSLALANEAAYQQLQGAPSSDVGVIQGTHEVIILIVTSLQIASY